MRHTFQLKSGELNASLIRNIKQIFKNKDLQITIEEKAITPKPSQKELALRVVALTERFKDVKIDPDLDLSSLANEANL